MSVIGHRLVTQCGTEPMVAVCTQLHVCTQCLFRGGQERLAVAALAGVAAASTAKPSTAARIFLMVPSRDSLGVITADAVRPSPCTDRDDALIRSRGETIVNG